MIKLGAFMPLNVARHSSFSLLVSWGDVYVRGWSWFGGKSLVNRRELVIVVRENGSVSAR